MAYLYSSWEFENVNKKGWGGEQSNKTTNTKKECDKRMKKKECVINE